MIEKVIEWQTDRNLDKMPYNHYDETLNRLEEICEGWGLNRNNAINLLAQIDEQSDARFLNADNTIDSLFDECVYAIGAMLKLGYDPIKVFEEGLKEINDRTGSYDAQVGKWVKNKPRENPYKADYSKAKL